MQTQGGATQLMYACQQCRENEVLEILRKQPYSVKDRDRTLKTPLHYCAENPNTSCAEAILKIAPELVNAQDENGYSTLHLAVIAGNKALIKLLITKGADVNVYDNEGHSAVHWAIVSSEKEALDLIIRAGADPSTPDIHGGYPLHYAVQMCGSGCEYVISSADSVKVVESLLNFGVDVNVKDKDGRQPILWAASAGSADAVIHLISGGACVEAADKDGLTALHCAASRGHTSTLETLITLCGSNVDVIDGNGCSALFYAVTLGHADGTELLLQLGAEPNRQDRKGRTPAHCGAAKGQLETLRILQKHGGNLWLRNVKGDIPLHEAVASGRKDLVLWLLSQNPEAINIANNDGRCPIHIAAMYNNTEMVKVLLDSKSLVNPVMRTSKGILMTPLNVALCKGHRSCGKFLQLHGGVPFSKVSKVETTTVYAVRISPSEDMMNTGEEIIIEPPSPSPRKFIKSKSPADEQEKTESADKKKVYRRRKKRKTSLNVENKDSDSDDSFQDLKVRTPDSRKSDRSNEVEDNVEDEKKRVYSNKNKTVDDNRSRSRSRGEKKSEVVEEKIERREVKKEILQRNKSFSETKNVSDLSPEDFPPQMQSVKQLDTVIIEPEIEVTQPVTEAQPESVEILITKSADSQNEAENRVEESKEDKNNTQESKESSSGTEKSARGSKRFNGKKEDRSSKSSSKSSNDESSTKKVGKSSGSKSSSENSTRKEEKNKSGGKSSSGDSGEKSKKSGSPKTPKIKDENLLKVPEIKTPVAETCEEEKPNEETVESRKLKVETAIESVEVKINTEAEPVTNDTETAEVVVNGNETSEAVANTESAEVVASTETVKVVASTETAEAVANTETTEAVAIAEKAEVDANTEASVLESNETQPTVSDASNVEIVAQKQPQDANIETTASEKEVQNLVPESGEKVAEAVESTVEVPSPSEASVAPEVNETNEEMSKAEVVAAGQEEVETKNEEDNVSSPVDAAKEEETSSASLVKDASTKLPEKENPVDDILLRNIEEDVIVVEEAKDKTLEASPVVEEEVAVENIPEKEEESSGVILEKDPEEVETTKTVDATEETAEPGQNEPKEERNPNPATEENDKKGESESLLTDSLDKNEEENDKSTGNESSFLYNKETNEWMNGGPRHYKAPRVSRLCRRHRDFKNDLSQVSVTQLVQNTIRKYHMERGIFYQLLELKRLQIRAGRANEQVLVKRLADDYERSRAFIGMKHFTGLYKFKEFEKFLYEQLKALNGRNSFIIPEIKSFDDIDALSGILKKSRYKIIGEIPQSERICTCITQRCHHSACAYTSVPCSAYIANVKHHKMHKAKKECFLPRIDQSPNKTEKEKFEGATLELIQGNEKRVIVLPQNYPDKGKRYYVTFTIKGSPSFKEEDYFDESKDYFKHRHAKSV